MGNKVEENEVFIMKLIDWKVAFVSIDMRIIRNMLEELEIHQKFVRIIRSIYKKD